MDAKILLGIGAIGGAVYLATSKKAQARVKKTTGLSDGKNNDNYNYIVKGFNSNGYKIIETNLNTKIEANKKKKEFLKKENVSNVDIVKEPKMPIFTSNQFGGLKQGDIIKLKKGITKSYYPKVYDNQRLIVAGNVYYDDYKEWYTKFVDEDEGFSVGVNSEFTMGEFEKLKRKGPKIDPDNIPINFTIWNKKTGKWGLR
jgi:hypothetical protein